MFCPECGTLAFPNPDGNINCANYKCGYQGPQNPKFKNVQSSTKAQTRVYEVIKDSDELKGVLTIGDYLCPVSKCESNEVYAYLEQTRASDEPETRMLNCKACGKAWREF
jgi:transcription factor S